MNAIEAFQSTDIADRLTALEAHIKRLDAELD
jgi:hypothetical protein